MILEYFGLANDAITTQKQNVNIDNLSTELKNNN